MSHNKKQYKDHVVYIIAGQYRDSINDRVEQITSLRPQFSKLVLISKGNNKFSENELEIKPNINPTGFLRKLKLHSLKKLLDKYLYFPSTALLYTNAVGEKLLTLVKQDFSNKKHVTVITCSPPHDLCLIGLSLKRQYPQLRWIMDWQDLWSYDESYFNRIPTFYRSRALQLEKEATSVSDLNITTNNYARQILIDNLGIPKEKSMDISHHFSKKDMQCLKLDAKSDTISPKKQTITIGFLGGFFKPPKVPGEKVVSIIRQLREEGINVELNVHGPVSDKYSDIVKKASSNGVIFHGATSHCESLRLIQQYDFLMILLEDLANCRVIMNLKLPYYLITEKPILAIVPESSALADGIKNTGTGFVIPSDKSWSNALEEIFIKYQRGDPMPQRNQVAIEEYSWDQLSERWIDAIVGNIDE